MHRLPSLKRVILRVQASSLTTLVFLKTAVTNARGTMQAKQKGEEAQAAAHTCLAGHSRGDFRLIIPSTGTSKWERHQSPCFFTFQAMAVTQRAVASQTNEVSM